MIVNIKLTKRENCDALNVKSGDVVALDLESVYLPMVLASEIYEDKSRTPIEAKKAQAIAARNYIMALAESGVVIDDTSKYQSFVWKNLDSIPECVRAVYETTGAVLRYGGDLITAWYSNHNGGRTKRSDEVWSAYKPWTVSQDDPWNRLGCEKWNVKSSPSHGVGMSQIGAAYAASIGKTHDEILSFYYPGTEIDVLYGKVGSMPMSTNTINQHEIKTNIGLRNFVQQLIGEPYWYGTCVYPCTSSLLSRKANQYPTHYTDARMPRYRNDISSGRTCADCIGLIKGYHWWNGEKAVNDGVGDVNTTGMFNAAKIRFKVDKSLPNYGVPEVPGLIMYKNGHVGVYEGDGQVIEAKGFAYGVIRSKIDATPWEYALVDPWISYAGYEDILNIPVAKPIVFPCAAIVTTRTDPSINIWNDIKKTRSVGKALKGSVLDVKSSAELNGFFAVAQNGINGYCDGAYLDLYNYNAMVSLDGVDDDAIDADYSSLAIIDNAFLYQARVHVMTSLNLRACPSLDAGNTIAMLKDGDVVSVLYEDQGANGMFSKVRFGNTEGFCTSNYLHRIIDER